MLINTDETGRDTLERTLEKILLNLSFFEEEIPDDEVHNDVFKSVTKEELVK